MIGPATFRRLLRARALLIADDGARVRDVARQVGVSQFGLIRQFTALFGETPHQLRTAARLDRAKLLLASGASVTQVCMEVGFTSLGSFSTLFAKRVGTPPVNYRRLAQVTAQLEAARPPRVHVPGCFGALSRLPPRNSREAGPG